MNPFRAIKRPITNLGERFIGAMEFVGGMGFLWGDTLASVPRALGEKRGRRLGWANLWAQMVRVGVRSIPIVSLVVFCIGAILALQMAPILHDYGATDRVADIIGVATTRTVVLTIVALIGVDLMFTAAFYFLGY